jgi:peptide chain release factor subunit 1
MQVSEQLLRELAQLAQTERTVLSAYLDLTKGWDAVKHFIDKEHSRLLPILSKEEKDYFETSVSFLFDFLKKKKTEKYHGPGLAFFVDLGADYTRGVELTVSPEPLLAVDDEAIIHPLALQLDEYEPIGVIMIDAACTRILIAAGQVIEDIDGFCKKIHHLSKVGGWSQMRYQRRRDKQIKHFAKDVIDKASEIFNEAGVKRIVIAGRNRMITALEQEFSQKWHDRVIARVPWDLDAGDKDFLQKIRPILEQTERNQEKDLLEKLVAELRRGGLAISGIDNTLKALKIGQVDTLLISKGIDFKISEELTSLAENTGAYVEFVPKENRTLTQIGGVGALLRYKIKI